MLPKTKAAGFRGSKSSVHNQRNIYGFRVNRPQSNRVLRTVQSGKLPLGFTHRPDEYGPSRKADRASPGDFDAVAIGMLDLASKLGAS
jgi:hypothetical protein